MNVLVAGLLASALSYGSVAAPAPVEPVRTSIQAYVTGYDYWDNTPPGSAEISHPILHQNAGGNGTFEDPTTVAVGHSIVKRKDILDWSAGTRFYIPDLHRYFIVEDTCGDGNKPQNGPCHKGYPAPATTWLDVWVGGKDSTRAKSEACMEAITDIKTVIKDPEAGLPVTSGDISAKGGCNSK